MTYCLLKWRIQSIRIPKLPYIIWQHIPQVFLISKKGYLKSYVLESPNSVNPAIYGKEVEKFIKGTLENSKMSLAEFLEQYFSRKGKLFHKKNFLRTAPGERYNYSNIGSALAAHCIEVVSGMSFPEFTKKYVFDVVGMSDTGWSYDTIENEKHAVLYSKSGKPLPRYSLVTYPDGGLRTSITSLTKYFRSVLKCHQGEDTILETGSCKEMLTSRLTQGQYNTSEELKSNYGYFWEANPNGRFGHNGSDPGVLTLMYFFESANTGAIFFTNTDIDENPAASKQVQACWDAIRTYIRQKVKNEKT